MKLTQFNVKIFEEELTSLTKLIDQVNAASDAWLGVQSDRERGKFDQYAAQGHRQRLETLLNELRSKMATVYDFQGDRGMVDFIVPELNGNHVTEEEEIEVDAFDFDFFPKSQTNLLGSFFKNYRIP